MEITFGGNKKITAVYNGYEIRTDQPAAAGGDGTAPAPFDLFLASIGTCAGIFAVAFMQNRGLSAEGFKMNLDFDWDREARLIRKVGMKLTLPKDFPDKYRDALLKSVELCTVKRHLAAPPKFEIDLEQ